MLEQNLRSGVRDQTIEREAEQEDVVGKTDESEKIRNQIERRDDIRYDKGEERFVGGGHPRIAKQADHQAQKVRQMPNQAHHRGPAAALPATTTSPQNAHAAPSRRASSRGSAFVSAVLSGSLWTL